MPSHLFNMLCPIVQADREMSVTRSALKNQFLFENIVAVISYLVIKS